MDITHKFRMGIFTGLAALIVASSTPASVNPDEVLDPEPDKRCYFDNTDFEHYYDISKWLFYLERSAYKES